MFAFYVEDEAAAASQSSIEGSSWLKLAPVGLQQVPHLLAQLDLACEARLFLWFRPDPGTLYSTGNSWYAPFSTISMRFFVLLLLLLLVFPALFLFIAKLATAIAAGRGTWQLIRNRVEGREREWKVGGGGATRIKMQVVARCLRRVYLVAGLAIRRQTIVKCA